jgi:hypothetical protein
MQFSTIFKNNEKWIAEKAHLSSKEIWLKITEPTLQMAV